MTKRVLSLLLILVMLVGMLPVFAQAEETEASVDNGELTVEGTNGFGTLLAEDIAQEQETMEDQQQSGYTLTDLQITGNTATVTYDSLEEATVVVALYTEDGMQLLTSGKTTVNPEETTATVTIEGTMPEYFMASAYLLDSYDMSPLCPAYDTPMYTKEMQDLLASTAEDYDPDRVLQLEESPETNFAVYAETTKVIEPVEGVNTVAAVDEESNIYIIENADENITSLQVGDVFAYAYGETDILIVKVAAIRVNGSKVTITGDDLELDEVFEYAKIEGMSGTEMAQVDMSSADEGASYLGKVSDSPSPKAQNSRALNEGSFSGDISVKFEYKTNEKGKFHFVGVVKIHTKVSLEYYISRSYQKLMMRFDFGGEIEIGVEFDVLDKEGKNLEGKLGTVVLPVLPGINVAFTPALVAEISVSLNFKITYETSLGFGFEHDRNGVRYIDLCTTPKVTSDLQLEGKLFVGLKLTPSVEVLEGLIAEAKVSASIGFEFTGAATVVSSEYWSDERHDCIGCIEGDIFFRIKVTPSVQFFKSKKLKYSAELVNLKYKILDYYLCTQHGSGGLGKCPDISYRITINVTDANDATVPEVNIMSGTDKLLGTTNSHGVLTVYLPDGDYQFTAAVNGKTVTKQWTVTGADTIKMTFARSGTSGVPSFFDQMTDQDGANLGIVDAGALLASGTCGDNLTWKLYQSGTMNISGSGDMENYPDFSSTPWYNHNDVISRVIIREGVTTIGDYAFFCCENLTIATIPDSVTSIGDWGFSGCTSLTSITIPESVTSIGDRAFCGCTSLTNMIIPDGVTSIEYDAFSDCTSLTSITIPESVTSIGNGGFSGCTSLTSVTIPDSVTSIGTSAFSGCTSLTNMIIPDGVTSIEYDAFSDCTSLTSITIPESVTSIGDWGFSGCTSLTSITIPESVTSIGDWGFSGCTSLTSVIIPDGVTSIEHGAFLGCTSLTSVIIPNSVTSIWDWAFQYCRSLTSITIPESVTSIGDWGFSGCTSLTSVIIPDGVTSIETCAFSGCTSLTSVIIPDGVTSIEYGAFLGCTSLTSVIIPDSVTSIGYEAFSDCTNLTEVYYTGTENQWNAITISSGNSPLTIATIRCQYTGTMSKSTACTGGITGQLEGQMSTADAIFDGEYSTEIAENYVIKNANFSGLVPGKEYILLSLVSLDTEDPLAGDNFLFIDQATATEDGTLSFRYVQRESTELSYVMACGASNKDLKDAQITFPEMAADGQTQVVQPTVVYEGKTLVEGQDYVITGEVDFTNPGEYTCYIRGIYQYTGLVPCTYLVAGGEATVTGAVVTGADGDALVELFSGDTLIGSVTASGKTGSYSFEGIETGIYTLRISKNTHVTREYSLTVGAGTVTQDVKIHLIGDVSGDGRINVGDVARIYAYSKKTGELSDYEFLCADVSGDGRVNVGDASRVYGHSKKTSSLW